MITQHFRFVYFSVSENGFVINCKTHAHPICDSIILSFRSLFQLQHVLFSHTYMREQCMSKGRMKKDFLTKRGERTENVSAPRCVH